MHFNPILLVQASSIEDAKDKARTFCDCECGDHGYFDYGDIIDDDTKTKFNKPVTEVKDLLPEDEHLATANKLLADAGGFRQAGNVKSAGDYYRRAGKLLSECLCTDYEVFNIDYNDYTRIFEPDWYAVEADLHF
jgi:hypothetical protein